MRLGIVGGTFDPVHVGHLLIAEEARIALELQRVLFVPTGRPWLKAERPISPGRHRLRMVELAIADNPAFAASPLEVERPGATYTVDTLRELPQRGYSDAEVFFIMGMDSLGEFHRWKEPLEILERCTLAVFRRPGHDEAVLEDLERRLGPVVRRRVRLMDGIRIDISGTEIRRRVARGVSVRYQVPDEVYRYIQEHGLYQSAGNAP